MRAAPVTLVAAAVAACAEDGPTQAGVEVVMCQQDRGRCSERLVGLVDATEATLWGAVYAFTHDDIADAVVRAVERGVDVSIVLERSQDASRVLPLLQQGGVHLRYDGNSASMHHKFAVSDGAVTATGSFNWSANADYNNDENLLILHSQSVAEKFAAEFLRVWDLGEAP